jgi:hypothetical protein
MAPARLAAAAGLAAVAVLALAGCGGRGAAPAPVTTGPRMVATGGVERLLVATQRRRSPGLTVGGARCPERVPLRDGVRFRCTVAIERVRAPYDVTLSGVGAAGTGGRFSLRPAKPIIDVRRVVALIRSRLRPAARRATVDCGRARVRVVEVGAAIGCWVRLGAAGQRVSAVVTDLRGTVVLRA